MPIFKYVTVYRCYHGEDKHSEHACDHGCRVFRFGGMESVEWNGLERWPNSRFTRSKHSEGSSGQPVQVMLKILHEVHNTNCGKIEII